MSLRLETALARRLEDDPVHSDAEKSSGRTGWQGGSLTDGGLRFDDLYDNRIRREVMQAFQVRSKNSELVDYQQGPSKLWDKHERPNWQRSEREPSAETKLGSV